MQAILNKWATGVMSHSKVYLFIRIFFIVLLAASAIGKLANMTGFYLVVETYQAIPKGFIAMISWGLVSLELGLAVALLAGQYLKTVSAMVFLLHGLYFVWLTVALARGLDIQNCGCFGVYFARPLTLHTLLEDGFLLFMSGALWQAKPLNSTKNLIRPDPSR